MPLLSLSNSDDRYKGRSNRDFRHNLNLVLRLSSLIHLIAGCWQQCPFCSARRTQNKNVWEIAFGRGFDVLRPSDLAFADVWAAWQLAAKHATRVLTSSDVDGAGSWFN